MKRAILFYLIFIVLNADVFAASFDCSKSSTDIENIICSNDELSNMDDDVSSLYSQAKSVLPDKERLKKEQIQWIKETRSCGLDPNCISIKYTNRIQELTYLISIAPVQKDVQHIQEKISDKDLSTLSDVAKEVKKEKQDNAGANENSAKDDGEGISLLYIVLSAFFGGMFVYILVKPKSKINKNKNLEKNSSEPLANSENESIDFKNDKILITSYEHYLAADSNEYIRANVVYCELDNGQVVGCYSGYAGGGNSDCKFIWLDDTWSKCIVTDDESEFDQSLAPYFFAIQKIRSGYENWDDDEDRIKLSDKGKEFLNFDNSDDQLIVNMTENFELDVIELAQEQWSLLYSINNTDGADSEA